MIVRAVNEGWEVVFHSSHGLLAQLIATHIKPSATSVYWFETQVAIGTHDDMHRECTPEKHDHLTSTGAPRDFALVPMWDENRYAEMRDRIEEAYRKHTWIGILQSKHADVLYRSQNVSSEMVALLDAEAERRSAALKRLNVSESVLTETYDWMQFCDRLSLILCGNDVPKMHRRLEIISNNEGTRFDVWQRHDDYIHVQPWPFLQEAITLEIEFRVLHNMTFRDDADLAESLRNACLRKRVFNLSDLSN